MSSTTVGLCRGNFCSRSSNLKTMSTYSSFVLTTISTESAYKIRCDCPAATDPFVTLGALPEFQGY